MLSKRAHLLVAVALIAPGVFAAAMPSTAAAWAPNAAPIVADATFPLRDPFDYSDVVLLGNNNSATSRNLTAHFQQVRGLSASQVFLADLPAGETISEAQWDTFAAWFGGEMANRSLGADVNYIVTFKGVPIRVAWPGANGPTSFQDALMLLGGTHEAWIGTANLWGNPYFNRTERFSFAQFGFRLVTGIYAYNESTAMALIDRAANSLGSRGEFVLDADASKGYSNSHGTYGYANSALVWANASLTARGLPTYLDTNNTYVTGRTGVIGYSSWGSNDCCWGSVTQLALPHNTWMNGSIGETFVSTGGRTFTWPPSYGQSLIADWIDEGATGMKGYTDEPYINAIADAHILYGRYTDGFGLAESYWAASHFLGWRQIVVGDPKMAPFADIPDLSVNTTLTSVPTTVDQFGVLNLTLGLDNTGAIGQATLVRFSLGAAAVANMTADLPAHSAASYFLSIDLSALAPSSWGALSLAIDVDPEGAVAELDESNNTLSRPVEVRRAPVAAGALERNSVETFEVVVVNLSVALADRPIDFFEVRIDASAPSVVPAALDAATFTTSFNKSGSHVFRVVAVDIAGIRSPAVPTAPLSVLNRAPVAAAAANDTAPLSLVPVELNASASFDLDGSIWNFTWYTISVTGLGEPGGDPQVLLRAGPILVLLFATPVDHTIYVMVTDDEGATANASLLISVQNRAPLAVVSANSTAPPTLVPVSFSAEAAVDPDGSIVVYRFEFDDGLVVEGPLPVVEHAFARPGPSGVWLQVADRFGASDRVRLALAVENRDPQVAWGGGNSFDLAERIPAVFVASAQDLDGDLVSYVLDFGDGRRTTRAISGPAWSLSEGHTYGSQGNYTVTLTFTDDFGGSGSLSAVARVAHPSPQLIALAVVVNMGNLTVSYEVSSPYATLELVIELDGLAWRQIEIEAQGTFRVALPDLPPGNHSVRAWVTDGVTPTSHDGSAFVVEAPSPPPPPPLPETPATPSGSSPLLFVAVIGAAAAAGLAWFFLARGRRGSP